MWRVKSYTGFSTAQDHPIRLGSAECTALPQADFRVATSDYFRAAGIRVLAFSVKARPSTAPTLRR